MAKQIIHTSNAPQAIGAYSQAVKVGNTVYISGQIPLSPVTGELVSTEFHAQAQQVFHNLEAIIKEAGGDFSQVVKINAYLLDLQNFATFNEVMANFVPQPYPARAAVGVAQLPKGSLLEVEAILVLE